MGDPVENSSQIPAGYELVEDYERGVSYVRPVEGDDPGPVSSTPASSSDHFTTNALNLDSQITIPSDRAQDSRTREVSLRRLLVEAGQGTGWATQGLEYFLANKLSSTGHNMEMCYVASEANVADVLVQLRHGDGVAQTEAAKTILGIILGQPVDAGEDLQSLQRGLLLAATRISELTESDAFYNEIDGLDQQSWQRLWNLSHDSRTSPDPKLLKALKNSPHFQTNPSQNAVSQNNSLPTSLVGGGSLVSLGNSGDNSLLARASGSGFPSTVTDFQTLATIQGILSESIHQSGSDEAFIHTPAGRALSIRLGEIATTPGLTPAQISNTAYIAILTNQFSDFESAEGHYGEFRPVAARIAGNIVSGLGLAEGDNALPQGFSRTHLALAGTPGSSPAGTSSETGGTSSTLRRLAQSFATDLDSSLGFFAGQGNGVAPTVLGTVANSSTAAAGMMGINFLALAGGSSLPALSRGSNSRPHYYVEGATASERDGNSGSGSGSSGQGQQDQGQDHGQGENVFMA